MSIKQLLVALFVSSNFVVGNVFAQDIKSTHQTDKMIEAKRVIAKENRTYQAKDVDFYVNLKSNSTMLYSQNETVKKDLGLRTYHVLKEYKDEKGTIFYTLYDYKNQCIGNVKAEDTLKATNAWGRATSLAKPSYYSIKSSNYKIYSDQKWTSSVTAKNYSNQTVKVEEVYHHFNGDDYYVIIGSGDHILGYINAKALIASKNNWGVKVSDAKYLTVMNSNYKRYDNQGFHEVGTTANYQYKTIQSNGYYNHYNGNRYYSLFDKEAQWLGYTNGNAFKVSESEWGTKINETKYFTLTDGNYNFYTKRDFKAQKKSSEYINKTLKVSGYYAHFNGQIYYSVSDNAGNWIGYINKNAGKTQNNAWGTKINETKYFTLIDGDYNFYTKRDFSAKKASKPYTNMTLKSTGYYAHFNGQTYYSISDNHDHWLGYINKNAGKIANTAFGALQSLNTTSCAQKSDYDIYSDLKWTKKMKIKEILGNSVYTKGYYRHFNGNRYNCIYKQDGTFIGYVNADALANEINENGVYQYLVDIANDVVNKFGGYITSGYRPGSVNELGDPDDHSLRQAIDVAVNPSDPNVNTIYDKMRKYVVANYKHHLKYVIALNTWAYPAVNWLWVEYPYGSHMDHMHISGLSPNSFS